MLREQQLRVVHGVDNDIAFCNTKGSLNGIKETTTNALLDNNTVNHDINIVLLALGQLWHFGHIIDFPIHTDTNITIFLNLLDNTLMSAFFLADDRGQNLQALAFWQFQNLIHNLLHRRSLDSSMPVDTVRRPHTRVEETQIVIDFSRCSHRRARVFASRFLVDGNSWAEAINSIYIRLLHIAQELTSIG